MFCLNFRIDLCAVVHIITLCVEPKFPVQTLHFLSQTDTLFSKYTHTHYIIPALHVQVMGYATTNTMTLLYVYMYEYQMIAFNDMNYDAYICLLCFL